MVRLRQKNLLTFGAPRSNRVHHLNLINTLVVHIWLWKETTYSTEESCQP